MPRNGRHVLDRRRVNGRVCGFGVLEPLAQMTDAAIKRAERRSQNAELKAAGICIDCYAEHKTGTMRCVPCGDRNRGGPKLERSPGKRLAALYAIRASITPSRNNRWVYDGIRYWSRHKEELGETK